MIQKLSSENLKTLEERHEMILAHEKFGIKVRDIRDTYRISIGTYYYWKNRYTEGGFIGLVGKKRGPQIPYNKTPEKFGDKIVQTASNNRELDANDICEVICEQGFTTTVRTVERIMVKHHLNKSKGRRSKKKQEIKRKTLQSMKTQK
jgi:transposase